ncbi:MAG: HAMP domain-containing histidine kinase [Gemmatimonadetes bacterium]|nr:HAMP domain-containing histidine kinase [Gemmatimonadota bacterium]
MRTEAPGPGVAQDPAALLSAATDRVAARAHELGLDHAPSGAGGVDACLAELRRRVEQILDGADPEPVRAWAASNPLVGPLTQVFTRELLRDPVSDPDQAVAVVDTLRALAKVGSDPHAPSASERGGLEATMGGADAFELLVEIVHDFRSPLTSILFLSEALRDGHSGPVNETQRSQLGLMYGAAFELTSIASDVLDLARRERDLTDEDVELFSLPELFSTVERMVRPMVEERGLELKTLVPERAQARGHVHALSRVLLNLTTNALKFTDQGRVELEVRALPGDLFEFRVRDTGRGIHPEKQKELFKPFRRREGGTRAGPRFSASGVGLSITRRLLRGMNSELVLDFSDENGSQFSFVVPADSSD